MSYILDALQRAEAERERERGAVPGLQTRWIAPSHVANQPSIRTGMRWALAGALVLAITVGVGLWIWRTPGDSVPVALAVQDAPATSLAPNVAIVPTPLAVGTRTVAALVAPPAPSTKPTPPPALIEPVLPRPAESNKKKVEVPSTNAVTPSAAKSSAEVPLLKDLPEALRQQVPDLAISGAVYSENPAQRLLLVNGQVLSQGSAVTEDVTLEEIHPTTSDFSFKGTRFRLKH